MKATKYILGLILLLTTQFSFASTSYTVHPSNIYISGQYAYTYTPFMSIYMYADGRCGQLLKAAVMDSQFSLMVETVPRPINGANALTALEDRCALIRN